jgi:hypothetical protein
MSIEEEASCPSIDIYMPELLELSGGICNPPSIDEVGDVAPPGPLGWLEYLLYKLTEGSKIKSKQ